MTEGLLATIAILTYNGQDYLEEIIEACERQYVDGDFEILVIDSGSTDRTLEIIRPHFGVRLHTIPNSEFSHGKTRDLAVRLARGRYVAFITQDAVPADDRWLAELLAPFAISDRVAIVTGRQHPRHGAFPLQRYEIINAFASLGPENGITFVGAGAQPLKGPALDAAVFHSDVNAAVRVDLASGPIPFRKVPYAEDQMMARDVLEMGYVKAYAGRAAVIHSNDMSFSEFGPRIFDETVGLRRIGVPIPPLRWRHAIRFMATGALKDAVRLVRDRTFSRSWRYRWIFINTAYHWRKWTSYRRATLVDLEDDARIQAMSLEAQRKR